MDIDAEAMVQRLMFTGYTRPLILWRVKSRNRFYYLDKKNILRIYTGCNRDYRYIDTSEYMDVVSPDKFDELIEFCGYLAFPQPLYFRLGMRWKDAVQDMIKNRLRYEQQQIDEKAILNKCGFPEHDHKYVATVDKKIDIYSTGFTARVYLRPTNFLNFEGQKTFVRKYTKNLVAYAKIKISMNINAMRKIGNLAYYKVCEVTLTRTNSVVIKFELKDNIRQAIETMQKEVEKRDSPDV